MAPTPSATPGPSMSGETPFAEAWMERFSRQLLLPGVGGEGQLRLARTEVVVIGAEGVAGAMAAFHLGLAGVRGIILSASDGRTGENSTWPFPAPAAPVSREGEGRPSGDRLAALVAALGARDPEIRIRRFPETAMARAPIGGVAALVLGEGKLPEWLPGATWAAGVPLIGEKTPAGEAGEAPPGPGSENLSAGLRGILLASETLRLLLLPPPQGG
ncbi:MAG: ThiF family adenylyltransferase [Magnetococcales bacterium]|nr:ThiF family adenylyltransferase [Magnetococcales bacterium]